MSVDDVNCWSQIPGILLLNIYICVVCCISFTFVYVKFFCFFFNSSTVVCIKMFIFISHWTIPLSRRELSFCELHLILLLLSMFIYNACPTSTVSQAPFFFKEFLFALFIYLFMQHLSHIFNRFWFNFRKNKSFRPRERPKKGLKNLQTVKTLTAGQNLLNSTTIKTRKQPLTVTAQFQNSLTALMDTLNQV